MLRTDRIGLSAPLVRNACPLLLEFPDIAEHMADSFLKFDRESIYHIGRDCVVGNTPDLSPEAQKRICFDWGEKELYTKTSMPLVKKIWPEAEVIVRPGMEHCEAMAQDSDYIKKIESHWRMREGSR